jgi:hypothetical protein
VPRSDPFQNDDAVGIDNVDDTALDVAATVGKQWRSHASRRLARKAESFELVSVLA